MDLPKHLHSRSLASYLRCSFPPSHLTAPSFLLPPINSPTFLTAFREREKEGVCQCIRERERERNRRRRRQRSYRNMNALDSPLEALALNYLSFGFLTAVNNVWAWIAVITTAAVSVWRIRASSPRGKSLDESSLLTCYSSPAPSSSSVVERLAAEPASTSAEHHESNISSKPSAFVFQREGRTSGKFTVYFQEDDCRNDDDSIDGDDDCDVLGGGNDGGKEWSGNSWEVTMKVRMGDMGWYRYQDLTVLDGAVVRLWKGGEGVITW